jgi:hypothetical protein
MTAVLTQAARAEVIAKARATDGSRRALDAVAAEHGLMLDELMALLVARAARPASPRPKPKVETKVCTKCRVEQPIANYYENALSRGGRMAHCMTCNNRRPPTETRMVRNRARSRAYKVLADKYPAEFAEIYDEELQKARVEHTQVSAAAAAAGLHDAPVARLKPGKKRNGETAADRLDVARCPSCHTHHDAEHECPGCGETTPETAPRVKPWQIRAWAIEHGVDVPTRGPIPDAVQAAYAARQEAS